MAKKKSPTIKKSLSGVTVKSTPTGRGKYIVEWEKNNPYQPYKSDNAYLKKFKPERIKALEESNRKEWERKRDNYADIKFKAEQEKTKRKSSTYVSGVKRTPKQTNKMVDQLANTQVQRANRSAFDKINEVALTTALGVIPEFAAAKWASVGKTAYKGLSKADDIVDGISEVAKVNKSVTSTPKKYGLTFDELSTKGIKQKDLSLGELEDLGIGHYRTNGIVEYENGLQLRKYRNPKTNEDDVFLMYNPKTEENIAYMRNNTLDDNFKLKPSNEFHIKADMPTSSKEDVKFAMEELQKVLPPKHIIYEPKNISTDGLRIYNKQTSYGYKPIEQTTKTPISNADKAGMFKDLNIKQTSDPFTDVKFKDIQNTEMGVNRLKEFMTKNNISYPIETTNSNRMKVVLPKLQRQFGIVPPAMGVYGGAKLNNNMKNKPKMSLGGKIPKFKKGGKTNYFKTDKTAYVDSTLNANKDLEWIQRLTQENTPSITTPIERGGNGNYTSTHLMSDNGKGYVFPEVVSIDGKLQWLGNKAEDYARETNTGIQFPQKQGSWFAANGYKQGTNVLKPKFGKGGKLSKEDQELWDKLHPKKELSNWDKLKATGKDAYNLAANTLDLGHKSVMWGVTTGLGAANGYGWDEGKFENIGDLTRKYGMSEGGKKLASTLGISENALSAGVELMADPLNIVNFSKYPKIIGALKSIGSNNKTTKAYKILEAAKLIDNADDVYTNLSSPNPEDSSEPMLNYKEDTNATRIADGVTINPQEYSYGGSILSGAGGMAGIGMTIGGPVGAAIGGLAGGAMGFFKERATKQAELEAQRLQSEQIAKQQGQMNMQADRSILSSFPTNGVNQSYFEKGGSIGNKTDEKSKIEKKQQYLIDKGYAIKKDGIWGNKSQTAWDDHSKKQQGLGNTLVGDFIGDKQRAFMHKLLGMPLSGAQLLTDIQGYSPELNEGDLTKDELDALRKIVRRNLKSGKTNIEYKDYETGTQYGDVGGAPTTVKGAVDRVFSPEYALKTTLGQANINITPENDTIVSDRYNFNDANNTGNLVEKLQESATIDPYQAFRKVGKNFGSPEGSGSKVNININKDNSMFEKIFGIPTNFKFWESKPEKKALGGSLNPISQTMSKVQGNSHAQGGVNMMANGRPIEVEGGEVIDKQGNYVYSDKLYLDDNEVEQFMQLINM